MTDTELVALAALVNAYASETNAANDGRNHRGEAMAYDGFAGPEEMKKLQEELVRRGVLKY
jgi:hypothetical protein